MSSVWKPSGTNWTGLPALTVMLDGKNALTSPLSFWNCLPAAGGVPMRTVLTAAEALPGSRIAAPRAPSSKARGFTRLLLDWVGARSPSKAGWTVVGVGTLSREGAMVSGAQRIEAPGENGRDVDPHGGRHRLVLGGAPGQGSR